MKKKNLLVVCAAAVICLMFALVLAGGMNIYAEKSGTQEFEPEVEENEASDMLTQILAEDGEETAGAEAAETKAKAEDKAEAAEADAETETKSQADAGAEAVEAKAEAEAEKTDAKARAAEEKNRAKTEDAKARAEAEKTQASARAAAETGELREEELKAVWDKMYQEYGEAGKGDTKQQEDFTDEMIDVNEAGLILLKEINHIYPNDSPEDLKIGWMELERCTVPGEEHIVYWTGKLENGYAPTEENYRSYSCQIDSVSGKMVSFGKFRPYQKEKDYSVISWTDEQIKEQAKQLIETYDLFQGEELNWDTVKVYSGKEEIDSLKDDFKDKPNLSVSVCNTLVFDKNGQIIIYFCMDWETGEISNYLW